MTLHPVDSNAETARILSRMDKTAYPSATYCAACHHRCDPARIFADPVCSERQQQDLSPCCGARLIDRRMALIHYLAQRLNRHFIHKEKASFTLPALASLRAGKEQP